MVDENTVLGLATIRENRGISLEQIADGTKISIRLLRAIERGEFKKLPGGIYNTSYLKQYARFIDFDEDILLGFYRESLAAAAEAEQTKTGTDTMYFGVHPGGLTSH